MNINTKAAAADMIITIVMNTHTATAMPAVVDMTTGISIITLMRADAVKNTTTNTEKDVVVVKNIIITSMAMNVGADMNIIMGMTTMFRGIRRIANAKFAIRTKNTATCAAKVWKTAPAKCLMPTA